MCSNLFYFSFVSLNPEADWSFLKSFFCRHNMLKLPKTQNFDSICLCINKARPLSYQFRNYPVTYICFTKVIIEVVVKNFIGAQIWNLDIKRRFKWTLLLKGEKF